MLGKFFKKPALQCVKYVEPFTPMHCLKKLMLQDVTRYEKLYQLVDREFQRYQNHGGYPFHSIRGVALPHDAQVIKNYGLRMRLDGVLIPNGHPSLEIVYRGTPAANRQWQYYLRDLPGAKKSKTGTNFYEAGTQKFVFIPIELIRAVEADREGWLW